MIFIGAKKFVSIVGGILRELCGLIFASTYMSLLSYHSHPDGSRLSAVCHPLIVLQMRGLKIILQKQLGLFPI
jgi:hypothetical protein